MKASPQLHLNAIRPVSIHTAWLRYPASAHVIENRVVFPHVVIEAVLIRGSLNLHRRPL